jgi:hypothetical protein
LAYHHDEVPMRIAGTLQTVSLLALALVARPAS